jgi:hypothetical protein
MRGYPAQAATVAMTESDPLNYESKTTVPPVPRVWGLSRYVWLLIAGFCAFVEFAGAFATNGRVNGRGDVAFIVVFAVVGVIAFVNALRLLWRAG